MNIKRRKFLKAAAAAGLAGGMVVGVFQLGLPSSVAHQYVAVKFGAPVVKGANFAHYQVIVNR